MCREGKYKSHGMYIATTGTVAGNALKSGVKPMAMATVRREVLSEWKRTLRRVGCGSWRRGSVKIKKKRRRIHSWLQIKDQTNRSTPSAGCVVFFFQPPFSPERILPFSPSPFTPSLRPDPIGPFDSSFHLPVGSSQVSKARDAQKSRLGWTRFKTLAFCYPRVGGEKKD